MNESSKLYYVTLKRTLRYFQGTKKRRVMGKKKNYSKIVDLAWFKGDFNRWILISSVSKVFCHRVRDLSLNLAYTKN